MSARLKFNAVLSLLCAVLFYMFFTFTKHDRVVSPLVPFGDDPYDAVGSFSMIVSFLSAFRSVFLAFRPYRIGTPSPLSSLFLARTQIAIPVGVLVALAADVIALGRHPAQWVQRPASGKLLILMVGMALISLGLTALFRSGVTPSVSARPYQRRALLVATLFLTALALFPENLIQSAGLHLLTILFGFALIAAMQATFAVAVLPHQELATSPTPEPNLRRARAWVPWAWIAAFGVLLGVSVFAAERGEGSGVPADRIPVVAALFVGSGTGLGVISFAFLRKPLGLFQKSNA